MLRSILLQVTRVIGQKRSRPLRLFALVCALSAGFGGMFSAVQAASRFGFKQYRVPTTDSAPRHITVGADGNLWFTEGNEVFTPEFETYSNIGRITPGGEITEFRVDCFCFLNDIVQGPGDILYFTHNNAGLGRITTAGVVLPDVVPRDDQGNEITSALGNGLTANGTDVWYTDFNNDRIWRYTAADGAFTPFQLPTGPSGNNPYDVAVDPHGIVWYTDFHAGVIGRLDPATGAITETPVPGSGGPRHIAIAADGSVWFTERFTHRIGRLDPAANNQVTQFPTLTPSAGPEDIAAAPDGSLWFTQSNAGNVARITGDGVITEEGKIIGDGEPFGITVGPDGQSVWYALMSANKIAALRPR